METKDTTVVSWVDGQSVTMPARVILCDACGSCRFMFFIVQDSDGEYTHDHVQCVCCGKSFCNGACFKEKGGI